MSINERRARLDERMEAGIRSGDLSPSEAMSLRAEYRAVVRLDMRYRRGGYVTWEMADRDRPVDALAARIRWERRDGDRYGDNYRR